MFDFEMDVGVIVVIAVDTIDDFVPLTLCPDDNFGFFLTVLPKFRISDFDSIQLAGDRNFQNFV